jgi:hypothetical protein
MGQEFLDTAVHVGGQPRQHVLELPLNFVFQGSMVSAWQETR